MNSRSNAAGDSKQRGVLRSHAAGERKKKNSAIIYGGKTSWRCMLAQKHECTAPARPAATTGRLPPAPPREESSIAAAAAAAAAVLRRKGIESAVAVVVGAVDIVVIVVIVSAVVGHSVTAWPGCRCRCRRHRHCCCCLEGGSWCRCHCRCQPPPPPLPPLPPPPRPPRQPPLPPPGQMRASEERGQSSGAPGESTSKNARVFATHRKARHFRSFGARIHRRPILVGGKERHRGR